MSDRHDSAFRTQSAWIKLMLFLCTRILSGGAVLNITTGAWLELIFNENVSFTVSYSYNSINSFTWLKISSTREEYNDENPNKVNVSIKTRRDICITESFSHWANYILREIENCSGLKGYAKSNNPERLSMFEEYLGPLKDLKSYELLQRGFITNDILGALEEIREPSVILDGVIRNKKFWDMIALFTLVLTINDDEDTSS